MRRFPMLGRPTLATALTLLTIACADQRGPLVPDAPPRPNADGSVDLNPQPEPPSQPLLLGFAVSPDGGDWFGTVFVGDQACGSIQFVHSDWSQTGVVTHIDYHLAIAGANPDFRLGADLSGILNPVRMALHGTVTEGAYAGQVVNPMGAVQTTSGGGPVDELTTIRGWLQLNPQPEPPSMEYPPSPCTG